MSICFSISDVDSTCHRRVISGWDGRLCAYLVKQSNKHVRVLNTHTCFLFGCRSQFAYDPFPLLIPLQITARHNPRKESCQLQVHCCRLSQHCEGRPSDRPSGRHGPGTPQGMIPGNGRELKEPDPTPIGHRHHTDRCRLNGFSAWRPWPPRGSHGLKPAHYLECAVTSLLQLFLFSSALFQKRRHDQVLENPASF